MYSPLNDLEKMFTSPDFFAFKVRINGTEFLGRPVNIHMVNIAGDKWKSLTFRVFKNLDAFERGEPQREIQVTPKEIVGLSVIDTWTKKDPSDINTILSICHEFDSIPIDANIGHFKKDIPVILKRLVSAVEAYNEEHEGFSLGYVKDAIIDLIDDFETFSPKLSQDQMESLLRIAKEQVAAKISYMVFQTVKRQ
jgi:hypothetical protein